MTKVNTDFAKMLGNRIKRHRLENRLTQEELAAKLNIDTNTVSRLECGSHLPSLKRLTQLSQVLGISTGSLLGEISTNYSDQDERFKNHIEGLRAHERDLILEVVKSMSDFFKSYRGSDSYLR